VRRATRSAVAAVPLAIVAADAMRFRRNQRERLHRRPAALKAAVAYLDDNPSASCDLKGCTNNTIDAVCKKLSCKARDLGCDGDYASGDCKDIKEFHDSAMCELAKGGCGDSLPRDDAPRCAHWWNFGCRLAPLFLDALRRA